MAKHPEIQSRLREELLNLGDNPQYGDIERLPYLDNFIKESLRLYPTGQYYPSPHCRHS